MSFKGYEKYVYMQGSPNADKRMNDSQCAAKWNLFSLPVKRSTSNKQNQ